MSDDKRNGREQFVKWANSQTSTGLSGKLPYIIAWEAWRASRDAALDEAAALVGSPRKDAWISTEYAANVILALKDPR